MLFLQAGNMVLCRYIYCMGIRYSLYSNTGYIDFDNWKIIDEQVALNKN